MHIAPLSESRGVMLEGLRAPVAVGAMGGDSQSVFQPSLHLFDSEMDTGKCEMEVALGAQ